MSEPARPSRLLSPLWAGIPLSRMFLGGIVAGLVVNGFSVEQMLREWDGASYLTIASSGYPAHVLSHYDAFLPGFPALVALLGALTGVTGAAVILSCAGQIVAVIYTARFIAAERDRRAGDFAGWMVALAPLGIFLASAYTEGVFLGAAAAAIYFSRRGQFGPAAAAVWAGSMVRITGLALALLLVAEYVRQRGWRPSRALVPILLSLSALPLVGLFMWWWTGDPLAPLHAQQPFFGIAPAPPWEGLRTTVGMASDPSWTGPVFAREAVAGIAGTVVCVAMWFWPRFPRTWALYSSAVMAMALCLSYWRSVPRYELALLPVLVMLADLTARARWLRPLIVGASAVVCFVTAALYLQGYWIA